MVSAILCLIVYLTAACDLPQCGKFSSCITRNRPETKEYFSCLLKSTDTAAAAAAAADRQVLSKCTVEFAALEGLVQMCNMAGQEGAIGYMCQRKNILELLIKFGTSYTLAENKENSV